MKTAASLLVAAIVLSACRGSLGSATSPASPTSPSSASEAALPKPTPTPLATATATSTPAPILETDDIAEVITTDLVVRSLPEISDRSVIHEIRLNQGDGLLLFVLDGPVASDGYEWYFVVPFQATMSDVAIPRPGIGWVPAGKGAEDWIAPWTGACPEPSVDSLRYLPAFLSLACFAGRELILHGDLGECSYVVPGTIQPAWLSTVFCSLYGDDEGQLIGPFGFHQEPEDFELRDGPRIAVRVTGSFDHPAAQQCQHNPLDGEKASPPELVVLACRSAFVATLVEEL